MKRTQVLLLVAVAFTGCPRQASHQKFSGTVELTEHSIGARVASRLVTLKVDEGAAVMKGELLATFDRYAQAERDYRRVLDLFRHGGTTRQALELAELTLEDQRVVSPVNGVVLVKVRTPGETLSAGSAVLVVGDRKDIWIKIYVPERLINKVQLDQTATVTLDGIEDKIKGHVSFVAPRAEFTPRNVQTEEERITQTFAVKVKLDDPPLYLRPGVPADVWLDW